MYRLEVRPSVASAVKRFDADMRRYWDICLQQIAANPMPRYGTYTERDLPVPGFPPRTYNYEVSEEMSVSGEVFCVLVAEFFPFYCPLYTIHEANRVVEIFYLRGNPFV